MKYVKERFSKDPKVILISIGEFYLRYSYFDWFESYVIMKDNTITYTYEESIKFTPHYLISIKTKYYLANYGTEEKESIDEIIVSYRNGQDEYDLLEKKVDELKDILGTKKTKNILNQIDNINKIKSILPKYKEKQKNSAKSFESYLVDTGYKTSLDKFKKRYLVFDVETNGLRKTNDDLLSLSIYDPQTGLCYNRFLPLDLQPTVLTTSINGIKDEDLEDCTHITQEELNELIDRFDLKNSTLLFYAGNNFFDAEFVDNYCQRQGISGFESLELKNIKDYTPKTSFSTAGMMTKDNLCRIFGIEGVSDVHSGINDCLLEWKLFEKIYDEKLVVIDRFLYRYSPDYIIPISYLTNYPTIRELSRIEIPTINNDTKKIFEYSFPQAAIKKIKKFPTNITGITIENAINSLLKAEKQNNIDFLKDNKKKLDYIGSFDSKYTEIPIIEEADGTITSVLNEFDEYINEINDVTKVVMVNLSPVIEYIKDNIFKNEKIITQELVLSDDKKILALCDLSSNSSILEIKTKEVLNILNKVEDKISCQLFYESNGRKTYIMSIIFEIGPRNHDVIDITITIYRVSFKIHKSVGLDCYHLIVLKNILNNPFLSKNKLKKECNIGTFWFDKSLDFLINNGYVRLDNTYKNVHWVVLNEEEIKSLIVDKNI